ncbi:SMC-Scp complex subunit ScpB [Luteimonas aestuarii]|uniref:SMC-Scp complex subunit ScpB n=1 Tax=Luteimonas aestuarii TaxID=453837 RepID=A0A4R5TJ17_9GAMM|nr:SMC-Scp complex subunit ScpB [Luteimonas aestuarii]
MDQALINRIVEAALLAASQPLTLVQLNGLFPLDEPAPDGSVQQALADLQAACADRGVELVEVASGWRYQVKADVHPWVARLWTERQVKYTRATLETLALIAYRQPITRGEIEQVRGVAVNSNIIKALEEREWIRVVGHRDIPGRPELLGTTKGFLDYFGLKRLDELPPLSELKDFGELEPQFEFGDAPRAVGDVASPDGDTHSGTLEHVDDPDAGTSADASGLAGGADFAANDDGSDEGDAPTDNGDDPQADDQGHEDAGDDDSDTPPTSPDDGDAHNATNAPADDGDGTRSNA